MTEITNYKQGVPKRDGSGQGIRANINRGECNSPKPTGQGRRNRVVY